MGKVKLTGAEVSFLRFGSLDRIPRQAENSGLKAKLTIPVCFLQVADPVPPLDAMPAMGSVIPREDGRIIRGRNKVSLGGPGRRFDPFGLEDKG